MEWEKREKQARMGSEICRRLSKICPWAVEEEMNRCLLPRLEWLFWGCWASLFSVQGFNGRRGFFPSSGPWAGICWLLLSAFLPSIFFPCFALSGYWIIGPLSSFYTNLWTHVSYFPAFWFFLSLFPGWQAWHHDSTGDCRQVSEARHRHALRRECIGRLLHFLFFLSWIFFN